MPYKTKSVGVVIPCFNEETLIETVLSSLPEFVDKIYVVDDCSTDNTVSVIEKVARKSEKNIQLLRHLVNQGVGGAIATGYKAALIDKMDVTVVMAGDAQMDPEELPDIIEPVASGEYDYAKGNRLFTGDAWNLIPKVRYIGNSFLSLFTKIASGYWHIVDSQSGYTAINLKALETIEWDKMYKRYGQPNDLLVRLNVYNFRVTDVTIRPIYGVGEKSGIKPLRMIPKLSWLLFKLFVFRMFQKYFIRDFHPLLFFYASGLVLFPLGSIFGAVLLFERIFVGPIAGTSALFAAFLMITGLQFLLFAMWFDMENNRELK